MNSFALFSATDSISSDAWRKENQLLDSFEGININSMKNEDPQLNFIEKQDFSFSNLPNSTFMLYNYDPYYSPLLSRIDKVFLMFSLNETNEACREKLICYIYANPAKYAPYSNLISAQLSR